jgi:signal transduction histidine kinase
VQFHPSRDQKDHADQLFSDLKRATRASGEVREPAVGWESFVALWERANSVRNFFWNQPICDEKILLTHFLARLRRFFAVDFCFGVLIVNGRKLAEVGMPESTVDQLPKNFSRRCMSLVANSRAPITWNEVSGGLSFRSTVVAPLTPPVGPSLGFLMLGHAIRKSYSAAEMFVLQALAVELSWVARDLAFRKDQQRQLAAGARHVNDGLQEILSDTEQIGRKLGEANETNDDDQKVVQRIESTARQMQHGLSIFAVASASDLDEVEKVGEPVGDIATLVKQAIASCRHAAAERDIDIEVVYATRFLNAATVDRTALGAILHMLVNETARATRSEIVRLTVRCAADGLQLIIQGMESDQVAERLKALFEPRLLEENALDEKSEAFLQLREYLDKTGGDVYLRSRPGESAELVVCLPLKRSAQMGRPSSENHLSAEELA